MHRACRTRLSPNPAGETYQFVPRRTVMHAASCRVACSISQRSCADLRAVPTRADLEACSGARSGPASSNAVLASGPSNHPRCCWKSQAMRRTRVRPTARVALGGRPFPVNRPRWRLQQPGKVRSPKGERWSPCPELGRTGSTCWRRERRGETPSTTAPTRTASPSSARGLVNEPPRMATECEKESK